MGIASRGLMCTASYGLMDTVDELMDGRCGVDGQADADAVDGQVDGQVDADAVDGQVDAVDGRTPWTLWTLKTPRQGRMTARYGCEEPRGAESTEEPSA